MLHTLCHKYLFLSSKFLRSEVLFVIYVEPLCLGEPMYTVECNIHNALSNVADFVTACTNDHQRQVTG